MEFKDNLTLKFEDSFFREEIKCDYLVTEKQKKIWAIEIDLVCKLLEVCKKHNIKLIVYAGTLLGTIRHRGFIPWDDDFDVCLYRDDFEKLLKVAPEEFKEPYFFQTALSDRKYFFGYGRLRNSNTTGCILDFSSPCYNQGIFIDVYVSDGLCSDEQKLKKQIRKERFLFRLLSFYGHNTDSKSYVKRQIRKLLSIFICNVFFKLFKYETVVKCYNDNLSRYNDSSDEISILTHEMSIIKRMKFRKSDLDNIIYLPFENIDVPVPANYDEILSRMYGNYMEFPPIEQRGAWHEGVIEFDPDTPYKVYCRKNNSKKK